jgi:hypothetical protein
MSQAENRNTTTMSRRSALAGLSVLATAPAGATAGLAVDADAALIALVAQFEAMLPGITAAQDAGRDAAHAADVEIARRLGFPNDISKSRTSSNWWPTFVAVRTELGTDEIINAATPLLDRIDAVEIAIRTTPARTIAGMAVKAHIVAHHMDELWDVPEADLDYAERILRDLIENIFAAAGVPLPFDAGAAQS